MKGLFVLALLVAPVAAASVTASSVATAWLQSHKSPTDDQLKQLAGANSEAFAIVSALLGKHMKHMRAHAHEQSGAEVFRSMMTAPHLAKPRASLAYAYGEVAERAPVIDQSKYNANAASDRDESAVSRLLGAVAQLGGSKGKKISNLLSKRHNNKVASNALQDDASLFADEAPPAPVKNIEQVVQEVQAQVAPAAPAPEAKHENSYLKGIDLTGDMPVAAGAHHHHAHPKEESPYLKGFDLGGTSSLADFSFGDAAAPTPMPKKVVVAPKPKKENAFLKFLYSTKKAPAPEEKAAAPAPPAKKENSYLASVNFFGA